ncbi:hypothetical protein [Mycoplasma sp. ATU-Cv-508]|uniref:hypothetical protein n=1 Tax=Mycoplasma sp. ATU-Cv-508 TaxID=2048001 RepID=UPI000FDDD2C4
MAEGVLHGFFVIVFALIARAISPGYATPLFVVVGLTLLFVKSALVASWAVLPPFVYYLVAYEIDLLIYLTLIWFALGWSLVKSLNFEKNKYSYNAWVINACLLVSAVTLIVWQQVYQVGWQKIAQIHFFPFLTAFVVYSFLVLAINFLVSANILYQAVNFNFSRYYRTSLRDVAIGQLISEQKVNFGIYGIFVFRYPPLRSIEKNLEIRESVLLDFEKAFPSEAILFRADQKRYGFFLPLSAKPDYRFSLTGNASSDRSPQDALFTLEKIVKRRSTTYLTSWEEKVPVKIYAGVAFYGLQSQSIWQLNDMANFALANFSKNRENVVQLFDPVVERKIVNQTRELSLLDKRIGLDNFVNYFVPLYDLKKGQTVLNFVRTEKVDYSDLKETVNKYINFLGWQRVFDRYVAFTSLSKLTSRTSLAFFYAPQILTTDFDARIFMRRLESMDVLPTQVVLIFADHLLAKVREWGKLRQNVLLLKKQGVRIAFFASKSFRLIWLEQLRPKFLFCASEALNVCASEQIRKIAPQIKTVAFEIEDLNSFTRALNSVLI